MENLSPLNGPHRSAVAIPNRSWLQDHRFMGRAVLPGVCALECLAGKVAQSFADADVTFLEDVRFDKLLPLPSPATPFVDALVELVPVPGIGIKASLLTRHVAAQSGMRRLKVHARAAFRTIAENTSETPPTPWRPTPPADALPVPADRLYRDMVPFGAAFRNVVAPVRLWTEGALAVVSGGPPTMGASTAMGSPFPLDAAFHAACAWAQRYQGVVAFPVSMARRRVWRSTQTGERYEAAVFFRDADRGGLHFDLQILDRQGRLAETVQDLVMRDISGGRLQPPEWIRIP